MSILQNKNRIAPVFGILVIVIYCIFTMISWAFYPFSFAPWTHYLSRLGNFDYSPFGAFFYNWGCILTGVALIPFFIGLHVWSSEGLLKRVLLIIGQGLGVSSAIALILIGVFSEDLGAPHMASSSIFFIINFVTLILISIALSTRTEFPKIIGVYGIFVSLSSLFLEIYLGGPIVEWYTVFASLLFIGLVSVITKRVFRD